MKTLVLGGTSFVGRAIVQDLLDQGHQPTLFTRGITNPDLFPGTPRITGDRATGDYTGISGDWDAVVDVSAYVPRHVDQALSAVGDAVGRYLLISTVSVYDASRAVDGLDEESPRLPEIRDTEQVTPDTYGGLKVACEDDVVGRLGARATVVRPGVVAGPHDVTDRFTYWVRRAAEGGRVAVGGDLEQPLQVVDVGDLARLCTLLLEEDRTGVFNAVGPAEPTTLGGMVRACAEAAGTTAEPVRVPEREGFPLILPPEMAPLFRASRARARTAGMPTTPLTETARATLAWDRERGLPPLAVGISREEEQALLG